MKKLWDTVGVVAFWVTWPALWIYLHRSRRTRVIIVSPDNKVLLMKGWLGPGKWILPGGGCHADESAEQGALREVFEETSIQLKPSDLHKFAEDRMADYGLSFSCVAYSVRLDTMPATIPQRFEVSGMTWMPLDDLQDVTPLTRELLAKWSG